MNRLLRAGAYVAVGLVALLPPIAYAISINMSGHSGGAYGSYWQGLMGNWFATVIGVIAGLPIALMLNRIAERTASAKRLTEEAHARRTRLRRLYEIVGRELRDNLADLRSTSQGTTPRLHFPVGRWEAIVASGEVRLIDNLETLEALAETYEAITTVNSLASMWLSSLNSGQGPSDATTTTLHRMLVDAACDALDLLEGCLAKIGTAIEA
jgi:uncharacterized membrane protein